MSDDEGTAEGTENVQQRFVGMARELVPRHISKLQLNLTEVQAAETVIEKHVIEGKRSRGAEIAARYYQKHRDLIRKRRNERARKRRQNESPEEKRKRLDERKRKKLEKLQQKDDENLKLLVPEGEKQAVDAVEVPTEKYNVRTVVTHIKVVTHHHSFGSQNRSIGESTGPRRYAVIEGRGNEGPDNKGKLLVCEEDGEEEWEGESDGDGIGEL